MGIWCVNIIPTCFIFCSIWESLGSEEWGMTSMGYALYYFIVFSRLRCFSPPDRWGLLDFIRAVVLLLVLLLLLRLRLLLLQFLQCALLDLNLGPSQLSVHRWTSTWDLPSSVGSAGPQPGTCPAQCAPLDLNLGPAQLSVHRWTSIWDLPSSVCTAGPQPGTCPAQCALLDLNGQIGVWVKIRYPNIWMVNTKLD